jgi:hypothetical protein
MFDELSCILYIFFAHLIIAFLFFILSSYWFLLGAIWESYIHVYCTKVCNIMYHIFFYAPPYVCRLIYLQEGSVKYHKIVDVNILWSSAIFPGPVVWCSNYWNLTQIFSQYETIFRYAIFKRTFFFKKDVLKSCYNICNILLFIHR